jgi:serine/threonine protein kinase
MVWHAFDPQHSREVTLMLPRVQLTDPQLLTQWKSRALAASKLLHPQVAPMLDFGVEGRWPYASYCRSFGVTLSEWLVAHPRPTPEQAAGWMSDILNALSFSHDAGISHGDIEPFSVVLNEQGEARLIGFGVPSFTPVSSATERQQRSSSLVYQNPQQGAKLDVLAVGLLLQYGLSGQMPLGNAGLAGVVAKMLAGGRESVPSACSPAPGGGGTFNLCP